MLDTKARELFDALKATRLNRVRAGAVLGVTRETIRQRLLSVGGIPGLLALAVSKGWCAQAEADALASLAALARQGANLPGDANHAHSANYTEIGALTASAEGRILSADMMATAVLMSQRSSVRVGGQDREFAKRVALELSLRLGLPREDMSEAIRRMIEFFRRQGDAAKVADMLVESERAEELARQVPAPAATAAEGPKRLRKSGDKE